MRFFMDVFKKNSHVMRVFPSVKIPNYIKLKLLPSIRWFEGNPVFIYFFPIAIRKMSASS